MIFDGPANNDQPFVKRFKFFESLLEIRRETRCGYRKPVPAWPLKLFARRT